MRADWLPTVLRAAGLKVVVMSGALTRGRALASIDAVVAHHTATGPNWTDAAVAKLLRDGRPDLAGPLAQLGLQRDGTFVVVATGRANHNGYGAYGNDTIGIEAYNDGRGERWPAVQLRAYDVGAAAILKKVGHPASRLLAHRETDPRRKIDPTGIEMDKMRARVKALMAPPPPPPPPEDDDDMAPPYSLWRLDGSNKVYRVARDGQSAIHVRNPAVLKIDQYILGAYGPNAGKVAVAVKPAKAGDPNLYQWLSDIIAAPGSVAEFS